MDHPTHFALLTIPYKSYVACLDRNEYAHGFRYCCGADQTNENSYGNFIPRGITCPGCLASAEYQELITMIEIAYDGNLDAYWNKVVNGEIQPQEPPNTLP